MNKPGLVNSDFPDLIWGRLKSWATIQATAEYSLTLEQCIMHVRVLCKELSGTATTLPDAVIAFYGRETLSRVERLRNEALAVAQLPAAKRIEPPEPDTLLEPAP